MLRLGRGLAAAAAVVGTATACKAEPEASAVAVFLALTLIAITILSALWVIRSLSLKQGALPEITLRPEIKLCWREGFDTNHGHNGHSNRVGMDGEGTTGRLPSQGCRQDPHGPVPDRSS